MRLEVVCHLPSFFILCFLGYTSAGTPYKVPPTQSNGAPPPYTPTPTPYPTPMYPIRSAYPQQNIYAQVGPLGSSRALPQEMVGVVTRAERPELEITGCVCWSPGSLLHPARLRGSAPCDPPHHGGAAQQHPLHSPLPSTRPRPHPPQQQHPHHGDGRRGDHGNECRWVCRTMWLRPGRGSLRG